MIAKKIKGQLSKVKFALGYNPVVERHERAETFIPEGYRAVFTLTADFELAWAPRYSHNHTDPLQASIEYARRERENVPDILELCDRYQVPITWATVGHLFLHSCAEVDGHKHPEIPVVPAYSGPYWDFQGADWFEYDPCADLATAPEWYAPDLIDRIVAAPAGHEIGCHTFSHIDCRDGVCPPELLESELHECRRLAAEKGLELRSFVHPGHTVGNLDTLARLGFTSYQSDPGNILGYPVRQSNGLWELKRSMILVYRPEWSIDYHLYRYKKIVDRAIDSGTVCNLWFHPSFSRRVAGEILPGLLAHLNERRDEIKLSTVGQYVEFLNAN